MIYYQLRCGIGHEFDGWFNNSAGFEAQSEQGLLSCPHCADVKISRALMIPHLGNVRSDATSAATESAQKSSGVPDALRSALQKMRSEIEANCDNVGINFAAESRRMHRGEAPQRPIYGESSEAEHRDLEAEGVPIQRIPWIERSDS